MVVVTRKDNGSHFVRALVGDRSVYMSYEADGHYHLRDPKAPRTWKDEARIRIARLEGYRDPERQHGYHDCQQRQPVANLKGDEHIVTISAGDPAVEPSPKYLRNPQVVDVPDWRPGLRVSVAIYLSESGQVAEAKGEQRVIFSGEPATVAVVSVE